MGLHLGDQKRADIAVLGIVECDVSFTSDRELVCRHSNCDLHFTTGKMLQKEWEDDSN